VIVLAELGASGLRGVAGMNLNLLLEGQYALLYCR
jgi:hypothetical protein